MDPAEAPIFLRLFTSQQMGVERIEWMVRI